MDDLISRQLVIKTLCERRCGNKSKGCPSGFCTESLAVDCIPSAQPDLDSAYTEGYTAAESKYRKMWDEMPKIIRCKDCVHYYGEPGNPNIICFQMHEDDFCSYAERREE